MAVKRVMSEAKERTEEERYAYCTGKENAKKISEKGRGRTRTREESKRGSSEETVALDLLGSLGWGADDAHNSLLTINQ